MKTESEVLLPVALKITSLVMCRRFCKKRWDKIKIMAAGGHKTINVFTRCNKVSPDKLKALVGENR